MQGGESLYLKAARLMAINFPQLTSLSPHVNSLTTCDCLPILDAYHVQMAWRIITLHFLGEHRVETCLFSLMRAASSTGGGVMRMTCFVPIS